MPRLFEYDESKRFNRGRELDSVHLTACEAVWGWMKDKDRTPVHKSIEHGYMTSNNHRDINPEDYHVGAFMWSTKIFNRYDGTESWENAICGTRDWFDQMVRRGKATWREGQE